jgi:AraC-like DNA-binding protein
MSREPHEWSTDDAAPAHRVAYWRDTVGEAMLEMEIRAADPAGFQAHLRQRALGPVGLNFVASSAHEVWRTRSAIAASKGSILFLFQLRAGGFELEQCRRRASLMPGDCVLFDARQPYHFRGSADLRCLAAAVPTDWLGRWLPAADAVIAAPLAGNWGRALSAAMTALTPDSVPSLPLPGGVVAEQIGALLALAADPGQPGIAPYPDRLLARLRETLRDRLHEAELDPATVAAQHGISRRYLHRLFLLAGTSFGRTLLALRLEEARRLLADPRFARHPIGDLAWRCGFVDASHFARRFRQDFGVSPTQYRQMRH